MNNLDEVMRIYKKERLNILNNEKNKLLVFKDKCENVLLINKIDEKLNVINNEIK